MKPAVTYAYQIVRAPFWLLSWPIVRLWQLAGRKKLAASVTQAAIVNAIGGTLTWGVIGIGAYFISPWHESWPEPCSGERLCIVVAGLQDDDNASQTKHVRASLEEAYRAADPNAPVQVIVVPRVIKWDLSGDIATVRRNAESTGQEWLKRLNGDVLIFGAVTERDRVLELHFLSSNQKGDSGGRYALDTKLTLPKDFGATLGTALAGIAVASAASAAQEGNYVVPALKPIARRLDHIVTHIPLSVNDESRGQMLSAYALVCRTIGEQSGDNSQLAKSVFLYRTALNERTDVSSYRVTTLNNLGIALALLGDRESGTMHLEDAIEVFRAALREQDRRRTSLDWSRTQNDLGNALQMLGERENSTTHLQQAVSAYRAALEERTRKRVPLDWAATQNNLGVALETLGQRESSITYLEEAVAAHRGALGEYVRDREPLDWALTQNNLGNALQRLGERESGTARLDEAVDAYRAALKEYARKHLPLEWAMTQSNLGSALTSLGERESGTQHLEEAVAMYRAALEERTRERVPLDWAMTQNNLGTALEALGQRESGTTRLEEAVVAYRKALEELTRERVPLQWAATQNNLGTALQNLGERESGTARLEEAVVAYRGALEVYEEAKADYYISRVQRNLARAEAKLAERRKQPSK